MASAPGAASAKVKDTLQGFSQKLNPLAQRVSKQLTTVRQWGEEKIGVAQDITELPHEYLELEKHTDALIRVHTALLKVTRTHQTPSYDYPAHLQETIADFSRTVGGKVIAGASGAMRDVSGGDASHQPPPSETSPSPGVAKTLAHALARACNEGAVAIGDQEPFGAALRKVAIVEEKIGDAKMKMDQEITKQVYLPLNTTLNSTLAHAMRARKNVQSLRLALDACKAQYRTAKPERAEEARLEVEQAEDQFVHAVEEASSVMRACIDSPEPLKDLSDLVVAQLTYCKQAHELLAELAPELDEMHVTQQALYRNTRSE